MMKPLMWPFAKVRKSNQGRNNRCSSHNGDTEHVAAAQSILAESEWG